MTTGILVDVVMPQMGVSVSEGTITRWAKQVGDTIAADETIVEISTDKVDTEVPSPASGVVREVLAEEGETVPVNTRIAVIDTGGSGATAGASEPPATPPSTPAERVAVPPAEPAAAPATPAARSRPGGSRAAGGQRLLRVARRPGGSQFRQPGGRPDAGRASPRHQPDSRHRQRWPRDQARRAPVHRERRRPRDSRSCPGGARGPGRGARRAALLGLARGRDRRADSSGTGPSGTGPRGRRPASRLRPPPPRRPPQRRPRPWAARSCTASRPSAR